MSDGLPLLVAELDGMRATQRSAIMAILTAQERAALEDCRTRLDSQLDAEAETFSPWLSERIAQAQANEGSALTDAAAKLLASLAPATPPRSALRVKPARGPTLLGALSKFARRRSFR